MAAARLGLDVALVAAVADDRFGHEIVNHLRDEGVDTSLLKLVTMRKPHLQASSSSSSATALLSIGRISMEVRLDIRDVDRLSQHFASCDAVLLTFEIPRETLQHTLALLNRLDEPRPIVIVTPGQPYPDTGISGQALSQIDYLVAHPWELGRYAPPDRKSFDVDAAARQLLAYGVETLCVPTDGGCYCLLRTTRHIQRAYLPIPVQRVLYGTRRLLRGACCQIDRQRTTIFGGSCSVGDSRDGRRNCGPSRCRTQCLIVGAWNNSLSDHGSALARVALRSAMQATPILSRDNFRFPIDAATINHRIQQSDLALLKSSRVSSLQFDETRSAEPLA